MSVSRASTSFVLIFDKLSSLDCQRALTGHTTKSYLWKGGAMTIAIFFLMFSNTLDTDYISGGMYENAKEMVIAVIFGETFFLSQN